MAAALCPECGSGVSVRGIPTLGQRLRCRECGTELRVIGLEPLEFNWADEEDREEEDWEEEEEDKEID
ncbi:MAG TPA: lysine biosynthesis protein LysW [Anaerolineae bacterium]|nr:lysine biosynthesis protein LysW [Anaerolineae bacterium]